MATQLSEERAALISDGIRKTALAIIDDESRDEMIARSSEEQVRVVEEAVLLTSNLVEKIALGRGDADPTAVSEWGDCLEKSVALIKVGAALAHQALTQIDSFSLVCAPALVLREVLTLHEYYGEHGQEVEDCVHAVALAWNQILLDPSHDPETCDAGDECGDLVATHAMMGFMLESPYVRPGMMFFAVVRLAAAMWREVENEGEDETSDAD